MFYWIAPYLIKVWGPFRLMSSHLMLLAVGTMTAGILTWLLLPKLWKLLPTDKGKILASDGGLKSIGKPTGAGMPISLILLPVTLLFAPLRLPELGVLVCLYHLFVFCH